MLNFIYTYHDSDSNQTKYVEVPENLSEDLVNDIANGHYEAFYTAALGEANLLANRAGRFSLLPGIPEPTGKTELIVQPMQQKDPDGWTVAEFSPTGKGVQVDIKIDFGSEAWDYIVRSTSEE